MGSTRLLAQCPTPAFTVSDTICPLQNLQIDNSSSTAVKFNWDFCIGDLDSLPSAVALPAVGGTLSYPLHMRIVEENGLYYGFVANSFGGNYITRYDFGSSPANTPLQVINLPTDPLLGNITTGLDMVKENGKWYMFLTAFSSNQMLRYEMDSLTQLNPPLVALSVSGMSSPYGLKVIGGYAFVANNTSGEISRYDFQGSYANTPTLLSPGIPTGVFNNFGIDIEYDCTLDKYVGYTSSFAFGTLNRIDFGNSLGNLPVVTLQSSTVFNAQGLNLVKENNDWHLFMVGSNNIFYHYKLGNSLLNTPVLDYTTNFGGIMADPQNIEMTKVGSTWIGISSNRLLFSLVRISFPQACQGTPVFSTEQSPTTINLPPTSLGYNRFELKETAADGTENNYVDSVLVQISPPEAAFSFGPACAGQPVTFTDQTDVCFGNLTNWLWDFGDGNSSTQQNPVHQYTAGGTYTVTLKVNSSNGDSSSTSNQLTIRSNPVCIISTADSACAGTGLTFTDNSTSADGNITQRNWLFGDGGTGTDSIAIHTYILPGTYYYQLVVTTAFGCTDTLSDSVRISPAPFAGFSLFNTCKGETTSFLNLTTASGTTVNNYLWNFGDGNSSSSTDPDHQYAPIASNYTVELIAVGANGCADTLTRNIRVASQPTPDFSVSDDTVCTFSTVSLTDSSEAAPGETIIKRIWDFGDGTIDSTSLNPQHFYAQPGPYTIRLTVVSPDNCDSSLVKSIFVIESPTADFSISNACLGDTHQFTDLSVAPSGSVVSSWNWDFGDGTISNSASTVHTYSDTGFYQVSLIVQSDIGCYDTLSKQAKVYSLPQAAFGFSKACTQQEVQLTDSSTVNDSQINSWSWNFGNGSPGNTNQNPTAIFTQAFAYPVTLIAGSAEGCRDTVTRIILVNQSPLFNISTPDHCFGTEVNLQHIPLPGTGNNLSYLWNFGDSTASFLPSPTHNYLHPGSYQVSLQVSDLSNGCLVTQNDSIIVFEKPAAGFISPSLCENNTAVLTDTSSINSDFITGWAWTVTGVGQSSSQNPSFLFAQPGSYAVKLLVTSSNNCKDSVLSTVTVNPLPEVSFSPNPYFGAPPLSIDFFNNSDTGSYQWNFGDGSDISILANPSHVYQDTGIFEVTLVTVDQNGCSDSTSRTIFVVLPIRDLALSGLSYTRDGDYWKMSATISNLGNETVNSFDLKTNLEGQGSFINSFSNLSIPVGQTVDLPLNTLLPSDLTPPNFICGEILNVNGQTDDRPENNSFCNSLVSEYAILGLYPNPAGNFVFAGINMTERGSIGIQITDISGKLCSELQVFRLDKGLNTITIPLVNLPAGVYFVKFTYEEKENILRLVRSR